MIMVQLWWINIVLKQKVRDTGKVDQAEDSMLG
jgi:hypothetical protein